MYHQLILLNVLLTNKKKKEVLLL